MTEKIISKLKLTFVPCQENNYQPSFLKSDFLFYYIFILFVLRIAIIPFYARFPESVFFAKITASLLTELVDKERVSLGLGSLTENPQLTKAAFFKAEDMLRHDYFGHESPEGISGWYWIKKAGYDYKIAGENLAIGFLDSGEVHEAWNNSPLHRENLVNPDFKEIGIAVLKGDFKGKEVTVAVQYFGTPKITEIVKEELIPPIEAKEVELREIEAQEPEISEEEVSKEVEGTLSPEEEKGPPSFQFSFWEFVTQKYNLIIEKIVFYSLIFITTILIFQAIVFTSLYFQKRWGLKLYQASMLKAFFLISLLVLLFFFNKQIAIYFIPHQLRIY